MISRRKPLPEPVPYRHEAINLDEEDDIDEIYMKRHTEQSQVFDDQNNDKEIDEKIEEYTENVEKFKIDLDLLNKYKAKPMNNPVRTIEEAEKKPEHKPVKPEKPEKKIQIKTEKLPETESEKPVEQEVKRILSKSAQFDMLLKRLRFKISGGEDISQDLESLRALGEDWLLKWCIIQEHKIKEAGLIFSKYDHDNRGRLVGENLVNAIAEVCELDKFKMNYLFSVLDLCGADPFKNGVDIKLFAIMIALANRILVRYVF